MFLNKLPDNVHGFIPSRDLQSRLMTSTSIPGHAYGVTINTSNATITNGGIVVQGKVVNKTFSGPNHHSWNYSVAVFNLTDKEKSLFNSSSRENVTIVGSHALRLSTAGDFIITSNLVLDGQKADTLAYGGLFWRGGFMRQNDSCCRLGRYGASFGYTKRSRNAHFTISLFIAAGEFRRRRSTIQYYMPIQHQSTIRILDLGFFSHNVCLI